MCFLPRTLCFSRKRRWAARFFSLLAFDTWLVMDLRWYFRLAGNFFCGGDGEGESAELMNKRVYIRMNE